MEAGKSKVCCVGQQVGDQCEDLTNVSVEVQRLSAGRIPSSPGEVNLVLVRLSADWMRPTKIMEGNLLYSKFTSLKVSLVQNTLTETLGIMSDQLSGIVVQPSRPKINYYRKASLSSFLKMWKLRIFKVK